jgi:hypothetical protein
MRNALGLTLVGVAFLWPANAVAGQPDVRLRQLDAVNALFGAGQGRLIAGQRVLYANPEALFAWPTAGGSYRRIALLPDLGEALNSLTEGGGFVRVEAIAGDRVLVARGEGSALSFTPDSGPGHHLRVGPATGPFADPAGCRERSGRPAALAGDLLAYLTAPARKPACPPGVTPAVGGPAILVRDLASGGAVRARLPLPYDGAVDRLALQGELLAYSIAVRPFDPELEREPASSLHVVDLSTGSELLTLPPATGRVWALDDGGGVVAGRARFGRRPRGACVGRLDDLRHYLPGNPAGAPLCSPPAAAPWRWTAVCSASPSHGRTAAPTSSTTSSQTARHACSQPWPESSPIQAPTICSSGTRPAPATTSASSRSRASYPPSPPAHCAARSRSAPSAACAPATDSEWSSAAPAAVSPTTPSSSPTPDRNGPRTTRATSACDRAGAAYCTAASHPAPRRKDPQGAS